MGNITAMASTPTVTSHTRGTRKVPRAVRERQMLEAAGRAFADRGFHAASVDAIAAASGITKPMIYAYFGSKDGLYRACMERARVRLLDALRDGVDTSAPAGATSTAVRAAPMARTRLRTVMLPPEVTAGKLRWVI